MFCKFIAHCSKIDISLQIGFCRLLAWRKFGVKAYIVRAYMRHLIKNKVRNVWQMGHFAIKRKAREVFVVF